MITPTPTYPLIATNLEVLVVNYVVTLKLNLYKDPLAPVYIGVYGYKLCNHIKTSHLEHRNFIGISLILPEKYKYKKIPTVQTRPMAWISPRASRN